VFIGQVTALLSGEKYADFQMRLAANPQLGASSAMKEKMFEELLGSVREAGAILRGQKKPARRTVIGPSGIRAIRERTSLSQPEFARLIGVSVKTLQDWEQDRRRPTGPAAALLRIIAHEPRLAVEAIHRT
jgi:putative transcriptional regulator